MTKEFVDSIYLYLTLGLFFPLEWPSTAHILYRFFMGSKTKIAV